MLSEPSARFRANPRCVVPTNALLFRPSEPTPSPFRSSYLILPTTTDTTTDLGIPGSNATGSPFTRSGLRNAEPT
jgi:hypothetical protein